MAEHSGISWTDHTFNPWIGCTKVSPACAHCYAERDMDHRFGRVKWGPNGTRSLTSEANWRLPIKWNKEAGSKGTRPRVFCASLADVFEDWDGPIVDHKGQRLFNSENGKFGYDERFAPVTMDDVRQRLFDLIDATPNLDWLLLTKRPENIKRMIERIHLDGGTTGRIMEWDIETPAHRYFRKNVWLGTTVENQEYADKRIPELLKCRDLAPVLFLSCEPMLGPIDLRPKAPDSYAWLGKYYGPHGFDPTGSQPRQDRVLNCFPKIDWVIAGGESGPEARPSHVDWFRSLRDQCEAAGVPFHFKQHGEWLPCSHARSKEQIEAVRKTTIAGKQSYYGAKLAWGHQGLKTSVEEGFRPEQINMVGTKIAGRLLDGVLHDAFPK